LYDRILHRDIKVLHRNVQRFRGGLVFKAHRLLYHSTLGLRGIKKKKKRRRRPVAHLGVLARENVVLVQGVQ